MSWNVDYESLNEIIRLENNVITATYADKPVNGGSDKAYRVCAALGAARRGEIINLNESNQLCVSADYKCGFAPDFDPEHLTFSVDKRHSHSSYTVAKMSRHRSLRLPYNFAKYIILAPLEKTSWKPDLVIFACKPLQAHSLVYTYIYDSGDVKSSFITGAVCHSALVFPLVVNDIQIGLIDEGGRKYGNYRPEELIVSMPTRVFLTILRNTQTRKELGPVDPHAQHVKKIRKG